MFWIVSSRFPHYLEKVMVTRRFRSASSVSLSAIGSASHAQHHFKGDSSRVMSSLSLFSTALARSRERGLLMASLPVLSV